MSNPLCDYCTSLPWDHLESWCETTSEDNRLAVDFRRVQPQNCRMCKVFYDMRGSWRRRFLTYIDSGPHSSFSGVLRFTEEEGRNSYGCIGVLENRNDTCPLSPDLVDFTHWRKAIEVCKDMHARMPVAQHHMQNFWLIDCKSMQVIPAPSECQYLALSYVWGNTAESDLQADFPQLPATLPRTIADAIYATTELHYNYLWVDRYCIDQRNDQAKHQQIQQMRAVYASAQITLIAAAGKDPDHGLPGVSLRRSYKTAPVVQIGLTTLVPTHIDILDEFKNSVWMSRAWTFQEYFVSRRKILFGDHVLIYSCWAETKTDLAEEMTWDGGDVHDQDFLNEDFLKSFLPSATTIVRRYNIHSWTRTCIEAYCARNLTYDSDALNAILGVLDHFSRLPETPMYHIWGVLVAPVDPTGPFSRRYPDCFEIALHWYHEKPCRRRAEFPSWSPLAWEGPVRHSGHTNCPNTIPMIPSDYSIRIFGAEKGYQSLEEWVTSGQCQLDSGRKDAPAVLQLVNVRTLPVCLERQPEGLVAVLQINDIWDVLLPVFWDSTAIENDMEETLGIIVTTYQHGDVSIMLLIPRGTEHYERVGMILWGYRTGVYAVRNRTTDIKQLLRSSRDKGELVNPPRFAMERRQDIALE